MRIALFTDTFYPKNDGMSTSTQHLAAALADQGHAVMVVAPRLGARVKDFTIPGVQIVWLRSIPAGIYPDLRLASWSPALHLKLVNFRPDVIHAMSPLPVSLTGMAHAKLHHLPIVMAFHTYFMDPEYLKVVKVKMTSKLVEGLGWDLAKTVHARADVTIAPTDYVAADLRAHEFKEPILTIPSGVVTKKPPVPPERIDKLRDKYKLAGKRVLVSIGRVSAEKNLPGLLRVFQSVSTQRDQAHLLIVGGGPDLKNAKAYARELEIENQVTFTGDVPHEQVLDGGYYQLGELFITASLSETQGMTSVEAQMAGLPVVAYHSKGLPFVIGEAGVMVAENDEAALSSALLDLYDHPEKLQALREKVPDNLARFDITLTSHRIVEAYQTAITINKNR